LLPPVSRYPDRKALETSVIPFLFFGLPRPERGPRPSAKTSRYSNARSMRSPFAGLLG
jgi:hypothetical protein